MFNTCPTLSYSLKCNSCGHVSEFETDGVKRDWACDNCTAFDLKVFDFTLHGDCRNLSPQAVEEYLENWMPDDGLELLAYMNDISHYSLADVRESLYHVVDLEDYRGYVVEQFIGSRDIDDDIMYYLDDDKIISDFETEHDVIEFWHYNYIFI